MPWGQESEGVYNKDVGPSWQDMENYEATYLNQTKLWINSFFQLIILQWQTS